MSPLAFSAAGGYMSGPEGKGLFFPPGAPLKGILKLPSGPPFFPQSPNLFGFRFSVLCLLFSLVTSTRLLPAFFPLFSLSLPFLILLPFLLLIDREGPRHSFGGLVRVCASEELGRRRKEEQIRTLLSRVEHINGLNSGDGAPRRRLGAKEGGRKSPSSETKPPTHQPTNSQQQAPSTQQQRPFPPVPPGAPAFRLSGVRAYFLTNNRSQHDHTQTSSPHFLPPPDTRLILSSCAHRYDPSSPRRQHARSTRGDWDPTSDALRPVLVRHTRNFGRPSPLETRERTRTRSGRLISPPRPSFFASSPHSLALFSSPST